MRRALLSVMLLTALLTGGCRVEDYNVVIKNIGARTIDDAAVVYGNFRSIGGIIIPGSQKGHGHPEYPIPAVATVEWRTEDGQMHQQQVEVRKRVPRGFRGDIQFEIADDNTVTLRLIPRPNVTY